MTHIQAFEPRQWFDQIEETLIEDHWQEVESHFIDKPPVLNREMYNALHDAGMLISIGAFDEDKIVGYAVAYVNRHPHYDVVYAVHDSLYLSPGYRKGRTGLQLIAAVEDEAYARGAEHIAWHAKPGSVFEHILIHKGYAPEEHIYQRRL